MLISYETFLENLDAVRAAIAEACAQSGREPAEVSLLPVTKNHPAEAARFALRAGLPAVGENRVQEARDKKADLGAGPLRWELIGHLQSNKAALAASLFDRIQSIDSIRLIDRLDRAAEEAGLALPVLIQVNAGRDPAKHGCELEDAHRIVEHALGCKHLRIDGLMTIAPLAEDPEVAIRTFAALRVCRDGLSESLGAPLPELSMGMTGDLWAAIQAGSTQIRVGTALFGARAESGAPPVGQPGAT